MGFLEGLGEVCGFFGRAEKSLTKEAFNKSPIEGGWAKET